MKIVRELLTSNIETLEKMGALNDFGSLWIEELMGLSYLLGYEDIYKQSLNLLSKIKLGDPTKNELGSVKSDLNKDRLEREEKIKKELAKEPDLKRLQKKFPIWNEKSIDNLIKVFKQKVPALKYAIEGDYSQAVKSCYHKEHGLDEQKLEFIISYLFIKKEFKQGLEIKENLITKDWSKKHLSIVELIEKNRIEEWKSLSGIFDEIHPDRTNVWKNFMFVKGLSGLVPYDIYPWNDEWEIR